MIGQGAYVKSLSPPPDPSSDPCGSEVLGICPPFTTTSCPPTPVPPLTPGDLRRLAKAPHPTHIIKCPRCDSLDTKFCYYNNYSLSQPRYFCKNCKRYWTAGGALRNVAVGGGLRKNKRSKLKLQAEAEAAAAAARDLLAHKECAQPQHYEGKPPSPVLASSAAMGSSSTSTSSVVSGIPANFVATAAPPNFHSNATHLIRTSSGSDGSTVEYAGNDNCGSAAGATFRKDQQQNSNQLQHCFGEVSGVPQFYSSYSTSLPSSNLQQYGGTLNEKGASYQAVGYVNQVVQSSSSSMNLLTGDKVAGSNPAHANSVSIGAAGYNVLTNSNGCEGGDVCSNELREEKEEIITNYPHYDWQLISENLFNGAASEGFLPLHGGSWPDF